MEFKGAEHYIMIWKMECKGTEHYIVVNTTLVDFFDETG